VNCTDGTSCEIELVAEMPLSISVCALTAETEMGTC
jgi:hypothetical protein